MDKLRQVFLVAFSIMVDMYDYSLKSLKEYVEGKEKKNKKADIR